MFVSDEPCRIITDSLNFCHEKKGLCTSAYVIMPTHMHAIFFDKSFDNERLQRSLADFRKFTGRPLSDYCAGHMPKCFLETLRANSTADRERRLWQPSRRPSSLLASVERPTHQATGVVKCALFLRGADYRDRTDPPKGAGAIPGVDPSHDRFPSFARSPGLAYSYGNGIRSSSDFLSLDLSVCVPRLIHYRYVRIFTLKSERRADHVLD